MTGKNAITNLRVEVNQDWKDRFDQFVSNKNISIKGAITNVLTFVMDLDDDVLQSVLLGQVKPSDDLIRLMIQRMEANAEASEADALGRDAADAGLRASDSKRQGQRRRQTP